MPKMPKTKICPYFHRKYKLNLNSFSQMDHGFQLMYMNLHRAEFNTFNVISSRNVCLDGDSIAKAIKMGSIVVGLKMKDKTTRICFTMRCTCSNCKPTY